MEKIIYTAIIGNYDSLKEPTVKTPGWKYICYTDQPNLRSKKWQIIKWEFIDDKSPRFLKLIVPFRYDLCIWIDASVQINCNLNTFLNRYFIDDLTVLTHPSRKCIYEEAKVCIERSKDKKEVIEAQIEKYKSEKYPINNGMVATGMIIRRQSNKVDEFCLKWWEEVRNYSRRDQLSFNYIQWKTKTSYITLPFSLLKKEFKLHSHLKR